jgi:hypothetical protein
MIKNQIRIILIAAMEETGEMITLKGFKSRRDEAKSTTNTENPLLK